MPCAKDGGRLVIGLEDITLDHDFTSLFLGNAARLLTSN
jgi:hypothetical protein